jgi:hypothetical protein
MVDSQLRKLYECFKRMARLRNHASSRTFLGFITVLVWTWITNFYLMSSVRNTRHNLHKLSDSEMNPIQVNGTTDPLDTESQNWIPASESDAESCRNIGGTIQSTGSSTSEEAALWKHLDCVHRLEVFYQEWCAHHETCPILVIIIRLLSLASSLHCTCRPLRLPSGGRRINASKDAIFACEELDYAQRKLKRNMARLPIQPIPSTPPSPHL